MSLESCTRNTGLIHVFMKKNTQVERKALHDPCTQQETAFLHNHCTTSYIRYMSLLSGTMPIRERPLSVLCVV